MTVATDGPALTGIDLSLRYPRQRDIAVEALSLAVRAGEIVALLGRNGAGKTTTLRMLTTQQRPLAGAVRVAEHDPYRDERSRRAALRLLGVAPEVAGLPARLTAREWLTFVGRAHGLGRDVHRRVAAVLAATDLVEVGDRWIEGYSTGMKQKTTLATALVHDPIFLVLDEPTAGLDPQSIRALKDMLRVAATHGVGVLVSTHTLDLARELGDTIVVIERGRLRARGTFADLRGLAGAGEAATLEDVFLSLTATDGR